MTWQFGIVALLLLPKFTRDMASAPPAAGPPRIVWPAPRGPANSAGGRTRGCSKRLKGEAGTQSGWVSLARDPGKPGVNGVSAIIDN